LLSPPGSAARAALIRSMRLCVSGQRMGEW
jgi:hypothetical protein